MERVKWEKFEEKQEVLKTLASFAYDELSVKVCTNKLAYTDVAGEFRRLVRTRGTQTARLLARKALKRRGINSGKL